MLFYENIAQVVNYMAQGAYLHWEGELANSIESCAQALYSLPYEPHELIAAVQGHSQAYKRAQIDVETCWSDLEGEEAEQAFSDAILWNLAHIEVHRIHKAAQEEQK